ncbi:hypothetical protein GCM10027082_41790 [Comamonas humi]
MHPPLLPQRLLRSCGTALGAAALACALPAQAAVVGSGTAGSCTEAALNTALSGGGVVTFDCGGPVTIALTTEKVLTTATNIDGAGLVTLDGNAAVRHFRLSNAVSYTLAGLSLVNGRTTDDGGAVHVNGATLLLNKVTLANNVASGMGTRGGALFATGGANVTLSEVKATGNQAASGGAIYTNTNSTLLLNGFIADGNHASVEGGALAHRGSALTVQQSLFTANSIDDPQEAGAAIVVAPHVGTSSLAIANSTFQGNTSAGGPGGSTLGVAMAPDGTIDNSTFAANGSADASVRAFFNATLTLRNTIVSHTTGGNNCRTSDGGAVVDGGNNLQFGGGTAQSCGASIPVADPQLAALADNGGFSRTMALLPGSPAIDAGSGCTATDQRLVARPIGPACDIGAYEAPLPTAPGGGGDGDPPSSAAPAPVPALAPAGLALLAALAGAAGLGALRRRHISGR